LRYAHDRFDELIWSIPEPEWQFDTDRLSADQVMPKVVGIGRTCTMQVRPGALRGQVAVRWVLTGAKPISDFEG
jgi:hypothetical protein